MYIPIKNKFSYKIVIPARSGSKRIPNKNFINFDGRPLICHSIEFALKSFSKDDIWVNTDNVIIKKIAQEYNVNVSVRPDHLGGDFTSSAEVLAFQYKEFQGLNIHCDAIILLQPTNPLRPAFLIEDAIREFEKSGRNSLAAFSINHKKLGLINNNIFTPVNYKFGQRSQDLRNEYFETGLIYITKSENILKNEIISSDVFPLIVEGLESMVDIDEPIDLYLGEAVLNFLKNNINESIY